MTHAKLTLIALLLGFACTGVSARGGELNDPQQAVETAGEGLRSAWSQNWYDPATDNVRPLDLKPPRQTTTSNWSLWSWFQSMLDWWGWGISVATLLYYLAWTAIIVLAILVVALFLRAYVRSERLRLTVADEVDPRATTLQRVEALPLVVDVAVTDLLAEAKRLYNSGDLAAAIVYLFSHQLLELDKHQLVHLVKGKTNRQYVREVERNAPASGLGTILQRTIRLFELAFFGRHVPPQAEFALLWQELPQFDQLARTASRSAAP